MKSPSKNDKDNKKSTDISLNNEKINEKKKTK